MPTCLDDCNTTTRHQTCPSTERKPLIGTIKHLKVSVQHVLFRVWVIHEEKVGTSTRDGTTNTTGKILTLLVCVPPPCRFTVDSQRHGGEYFFICIGCDQVSNLPPEIYRQVCGVRHHHDLLIRVTTKEPRGVEDRDQLRLAMTWWHVNTYTVLVPLLDIHQHICKDAVVPPHDIVRVHLLTERQQVIERCLIRLASRQLVHHLVDLLHFFRGQVIQSLK